MSVLLRITGDKDKLASDADLDTLRDRIRTLEMQCQINDVAIASLKDQLNQSEAAFRNAFMLAPAAFVLIDWEGRILTRNFEAEKYFDDIRPPPDGVRTTLTDLVTENSHLVVQRALLEVRRKEQRTEVFVETIAGTTIKLIMTPSAISPLQAQLGILCKLSDVGPAMTSLSDGRDWMRNLIAEGAVRCFGRSYLVTDRHGRIEQLEADLGKLKIKAPHGLGRLATDVFPQRAGETIMRIIQNALRSKEVARDLLHIDDQESVGLYAVMAASRVIIFFDLDRDQPSGGKIDPTADRLNLIGTMAAGLAHQFNNIHHPMMAYLSEAMQSKDLDASKSSLAAAHELGAKAASLTRSILGFARPASGVSEVTQVSKVVENAFKFVGPTCEEQGIRLVSRVDQVIRVKCDAGKLEQVILNLLVNATHALTDAEVKLIEVSAHVEDNIVKIKVRDTGGGVRPEHLLRIWEPLFTTKAPNHGVSKTPSGTGLGLSLCRQIVMSYDGNISVDSVYGKGATFTIELPVSYTERPRKTTAAMPEKPSNAVSAVHDAHVLIVDDSAHVRAITALYLKRSGAHISECGNGDEALKTLETQIYDVALLDWRMPGLCGSDLVKAIKAQYPRLPIVVVSAVSEEEAEMLLSSGLVNAFLAKPFREDQLIQVVSSVLEENHLTNANANMKSALKNEATNEK